jgi:hypothetical protein
LRKKMNIGQKPVAPMTRTSGYCRREISLAEGRWRV